MSHDTIMPKHPKRPRDPAQLAKLIVDIAVGDVKDSPSLRAADNDSLGSSGGRVGGSARAAALSPERRREIARAAATRWQKGKNR